MTPWIYNWYYFYSPQANEMDYLSYWDWIQNLYNATRYFFWAGISAMHRLLARIVNSPRQMPSLPPSLTFGQILTHSLHSCQSVGLLTLLPPPTHPVCLFLSSSPLFTLFLCPGLPKNSLADSCVLGKHCNWLARHASSLPAPPPSLLTTTCLCCHPCWNGVWIKTMECSKQHDIPHD